MLPDPPQDLSSLTHFARDSLIWGQSRALTSCIAKRLL